MLEREYATDIRLPVVARRIATSDRSLQRAFSHRGLDFRRALRHIRMHNARRLVLMTDEPLGTIGERVGYREPSAFSKAFRQTFGKSPREMRYYRRDDRAPAPAC